MSNGRALPAQGAARSGRAPSRSAPSACGCTTSGGALTGRIKASVFVSGQMIYRVVTESGQELTVKEADSGEPRQAGAQVGSSWNPGDVVILSD